MKNFYVQQNIFQHLKKIPPDNITRRPLNCLQNFPRTDKDGEKFVALGFTFKHRQQTLVFLRKLQKEVHSD